MHEHVIHAHWYFIIVGYIVNVLASALLKSDEGCAASIVALGLGIAGNVLIGLGFIALLGLKVV